MKNDIAISTVSWIRTKEESKLVLQTIKYLSLLNIPIIIVDSGSPQKELNRIKEIPNVTLFQNIDDGLTKRLIYSNEQAAKLVDYIFYLQTDKVDFAKNTAPKMINIYRNLTKKGVLIPTRTKESIGTYPPYQKKAEAFLNFFMSDYIGIKNDYYAGPKIYPSFLVKYLRFLKADVGWGIEAYFYVLAKRLMLPFDFLPFYMRSPKDIDNIEETKQYRLKTVKDQIEAFLKAVQLKLLL